MDRALLKDLREVILFLKESAPQGHRLSPEWIAAVVNRLDADLARVSGKEGRAVADVLRRLDALGERFTVEANEEEDQVGVANAYKAAVACERLADIVREIPERAWPLLRAALATPAPVEALRLLKEARDHVVFSANNSSGAHLVNVQALLTRIDAALRDGGLGGG